MSSARKLPSLRMMMPSRTSLIGTNSCVACALTLLSAIVLYFEPAARTVHHPHLCPILYIKRPREVLEPALGQPRHYQRRLCLRGVLRGLSRWNFCFALLPQIELVAKKVAKRVLNSDNKRATINLVKRERSGKCHN